MFYFDEIHVENPSEVLFYKIVRSGKKAAKCKGKEIKKEKKIKGEIVAQFEDTTFILSDNIDACSEVIDTENYQYLIEGAYDSNGETFSCTNSECVSATPF